MDPEKTSIILGPPGTGKTTYLVGMPPGKQGPEGVVERAIADGIKPHEIGFISFTKKAAEEGRSRAALKFGLEPDQMPHFRTLHSMAFKYLGMRRDQVVAWFHLKELGKMLGMDFKGRGNVEEDDVYGMNSADRMLFLEGLARNAKVPLQEIWNDAFEDSIDWFELERFAKALKQFKHGRMLYDYTDMLEKFCTSSKGSMPKFKLLVVDEAQDLSALQWDAVDLLAKNADKIYIAGDDDQCIYKWAGADVNRFISLEGDVKVLDQSFRIPSSVFEMAEGISSKISKRRPKKWSSRTEVGQVNWFNDVEEIDMSKGTWLLLARNGYMLDGLEESCLSQGFSFHSVNKDPLKSPSLTAIKTWETLRRGQEESTERVIEALKLMAPKMIPTALMKQLKGDDPLAMYGMAELKRMGLKTDAIWHESLSKIPQVERDFFIAARRRGEPLLKEPRINISTIHGSKGGQAEHVVLLTDMSYRCHNNMQDNLDDETRVWYVAATRCSESLNLVMPKTNLNFEL